MDILLLLVVVLCLAVVRIILARAEERSRDQDALLMRLIQYGEQ